MTEINNLVLGATSCAAWTVALFFFRCFKLTKDRLFVFFAFAFLILGLQWLAQGIFSLPIETRPYLYLPRLLAFGLIIVAVVDKNRSTH